MSDFSIVDAHHHVWRQADLPWLLGRMQPRIFGPYEAIRRDYLIDEYLDDLAGTGVTRSVYVQANWAPDRFEDEVAWAQRISDESGWPHGIVGYADLLATDVRPQLDRLAKYPLLRGVRMQIHWHENEMLRATPGSIARMRACCEFQPAGPDRGFAAHRLLRSESGGKAGIPAPLPYPGALR